MRLPASVLVAVLTALIAAPARGQCPSGDVRLISQPQVESFAASYSSCRTLPANLTIGGAVLSTTPLAFLEDVEGFLWIVGNPDLKDVSFPVLGRIGGFLEVGYNDSLQTLYLPVLRSVGSRFELEENDMLRDVKVPLLESIGGDFAVRFAGQEVLELPGPLGIEMGGYRAGHQ